jgi:putative transposase
MLRTHNPLISNSRAMSSCKRPLRCLKYAESPIRRCCADLKLSRRTARCRALTRYRAIQTGVGPVEVRRAKVRDRGDVGAEDKIHFTSSILPKWARRTKSLDALLPVLYLRGVSTGDFQEALAALLGKDAPNLSPAVISRLTAEWQADYDAWQKLLWLRLAEQGIP